MVKGRGEYAKWERCTWEICFSPEKVSIEQGLESQVRSEGEAEVGPSHSSDEAYENKWSEGGGGLTIVKRKHAKHWMLDTHETGIENDKTTVRNTQEVTGTDASS